MDDEIRSDALDGCEVQAASWTSREARRTFGLCLESKLRSFSFSVNKVYGFLMTALPFLVATDR